MNFELIGHLVRLRYRLLWAKTRSRNGRIALFMACYLLLVLLIALFASGGFGAALVAVRTGKAELVAQAVLSSLYVQGVVAEAKLEERRRQEEAQGDKFGGRPPQVPDPEQAKPEPKAQRNFTDPESRIMKNGATKSFMQAYDAQAAVDSHAQIIVAAALTQEANDKKQLLPMLEQVAQNMGRKPEHATADAGYFSEAAVTDPKVGGIELLVPPERQKHCVGNETSPLNKNRRSPGFAGVAVEV